MRSSFTRSVGGRDLWVDLDAAGTRSARSGVLLELDIALVTPGGVPGVFDQPVVQAGG